MSAAIKIENLSKQYRLGTIGTGTISHDMNRFFAKIRGKEDPYLKIGEANDRTQKGDSDLVWALKDINFEVQQGEILGIIGKNGAGKSTLLKILSKVTGPTTGSIKAKGRIASLLEVGTGFHPELTGRENIFLNGAILGMNKFEIKSKLDEIVDFAGVERYLDTPVKRYSSGMMVRLGFAVAAHLEPEILVVDEVLAVGDAEFQKKAIGKMQDVSANQGRTVIFVSHNMTSIRSLCDRGVVLNNGKVQTVGTVDNCIEHYLSFSSANSNYNEVIKTSLGLVISELKVISLDEGQIFSGSSMKIQFKVQNQTEVHYKNLRVVFDILNDKGTHLFRLINLNDVITMNVDSNCNQMVNCVIPSLPLNSGDYYLSIRVRDGNKFLIDKDSVISFKVNEGDFFDIGKIDAFSGNILVKSNWNYINF